MKRTIVCIVILSWHILPAQQKLSDVNASRHPGAPPGFVGEKRPRVSQFQRFVTPIRVNNASYSATFYTFNDIAVFSYFDSTSVIIAKPAGNTFDTVANLNLPADSFDTLSPGNGIYVVSGSKPFAVLTGDAITSFASGYFAVDENGNGLSTKLDTWMMKSPSDFDPHFILFSYNGQTEFTLRDLATGNLLYEGMIDTTGYFDFPDATLLEGKAIQVTSDRPVSALSYTDQGYYVPSANGSFAGNLFYGFSGYIGGLENSITLTSYSDNNAIVITSLANGDTLLVDTLNHWQVKTLGILKDAFWKVSSTGILTAADIPFAGWGLGSNNYYYLTQCSDSTGKDIGSSFVIPTIAGDLSVFSYADNNEVRVIQLGDTSYPYQSTVQIMDTVLQNGGVAVLSTPSGNNVYRVQSENDISVVQSFGGGGAAFVPINNSAVNLPDLAISQSDIMFIPADSTYQTGQEITVNLTVHNYGTVAASNVAVAAFDGNPDLGFAPSLLSQSIPKIAAGAKTTLEFSMVVPPGAKYHSICVKVDPGDLITESNKSNNEAFRCLSPNNYIRSPLAVYFSSPGALKLQSGTLSPNPFTVSADIFNITDTTITNPSLIINVFSNNGMKIISGVIDTTISSFPGGGHLSLSWSLQANKDSSGFGLLNIRKLRPYIDTSTVTVGILVPDTISPPVPQGLNARTDSSGPGREMLTWKPDSVRDLAGYKVYYSTDSTNLLAGTGAEQGNSPIYVPDVDTFVVAGLTNGMDYWLAISAFDFSMNESLLSQPVKIFVVTKVQQSGSFPKTFALFQNFPNPFNPATLISYQLPGKAFVTLKVYDILGREVATLVHEEQSGGYYNVKFDAGNLPSGVYFYRLEVGTYHDTKKLLLLK
jgi:hypothetical protein